METGDRRARRTREAIRTALGELMMEQPFERITITAVAARGTSTAARSTCTMTAWRQSPGTLRSSCWRTCVR